MPASRFKFPDITFPFAPKSKREYIFLCDIEDMSKEKTKYLISNISKILWEGNKDYSKLIIEKDNKLYVTIEDWIQSNNRTIGSAFVAGFMDSHILGK